MIDRSRKPGDATERAEADVAKEFFVHMITKDILLEDCILDLIDNSIDGASRALQRYIERGDAPNDDRPLASFWVRLSLEPDRFVIEDNCGGIGLDDARHYAFHFGRKKGTDREPTASIGLYGIGMKRALFKMGRIAQVSSCTGTEAFAVLVDVDDWERPEREWDFPVYMEEVRPEVGTKVEVEDLNPGVGEAFADSVFLNGLRKAVGRDYSIFLQKGLRVEVGGMPVAPTIFALREGAGFEPGRLAYEEEGVQVELVAGMAAPPPEDTSAQAQAKMATELFGWYVLCNDRVVIAADKTPKTVWGDGDFNSWHGQYNGFMGILSFRADDPGKLPWTTTKRTVDLAAPLYRRAVPKMKRLTKVFIDYTETRKGDLDLAKAIESKTVSRPVAEVAIRPTMAVPRIAVPKVRMATIQYIRPLEELQRVADALGNRNMNYKRVGILTYEYFKKREVEG